ncbi:MAG: FAD binding domain-containing protein [Oligoflexia bacterium]|nr:FAD binding domain-containing protein [Oligoflexia bacterium]
MRETTIFYVNGERVEVNGAEVFLMLANWLRQQQSLTGTKIVCAEGDCGACSIMLGIPTASGALKYEQRNSCILPLFNLDGKHVVTVEGLKQKGELSPIQLSIATNGGSQCGYCTPGIVMAITAIFEQWPKPTEEHFRAGLSGNLCRCTGYDGILRAALAIDPTKIRALDTLWDLPEMKSELATIRHDPIAIKSDKLSLFMPDSLAKLLQIKATTTEVMVVAGATDLGVGWNKGIKKSGQFIGLARIPELNKIEVKDDLIEVGANVSLSQFEEFCNQHIPAIGKFMELIASPQIKNAATLIGNIGSALPIGDALLFLVLLDAHVELTGTKGTRLLSLNDYLLRGLNQDELITKITFKRPALMARLRFYKVSRRRRLDRSIVSAAFLLEQEQKAGHATISKFRVAFGGVAKSVCRLANVETFMQGRSLSAVTIEEAAKLALETCTPSANVRGSRQYREILIVNLFKKFYAEMEIDR